MSNSPEFFRVQSALNQAEAELQRLGDGLYFLVGTGGTVDVAGKRHAKDPLEALRRVASLKGCDPLLWRLGHVQGGVTLGAPYVLGPRREQTPRCAVDEEPLDRDRPAPLELYLGDRPVCARHARELAPLAVRVYDLLAAGDRLLDAFADSVAQLAGIDHPDLRAVVARRLARDLADRLVADGGADRADLSSDTRP